MALARTIIILFCLLERDLSSAKQRIIILIWEAINTPCRPTLLLHIVSWSCRRPRFLVHDRMEVKLANPNTPPPADAGARPRSVLPSSWQGPTPRCRPGPGRFCRECTELLPAPPESGRSSLSSSTGHPDKHYGFPPVSTTRLDGHQQVRMDGTLLHQPLSVPRPWEAEPHPRPSR